MLQIALIVVALAAPESRQEAELCLRRGNEAFRNDRVEEALQEYNAAFALFPSSRLMFNIGQAYESLGKDAEALAAFDKFITGANSDEHPNEGELAEKVVTARQRATALRIRLGPSLVARPSLPPIARTSASLGSSSSESSRDKITVEKNATPPTSRKKWWLICVGGVVVAAAVAGIILAASADRRMPCPAGNDLGCP